MKFCEECGAKLEDDAVFCEECGTRLKKASPKIQEKKVNAKKSNNVGVVFLCISVAVGILVILMFVQGKITEDVINGEVTNKVETSEAIATETLIIEEPSIEKSASEESVMEESIAEEVPLEQETFEQESENEKVQDDIEDYVVDDDEGQSPIMSEEEQLYMIEQKIIPAYEQYVRDNFPYMSFAPYSLIYLNDDTIPELVVQGDCEATGYMICTYVNDSVVTMNTNGLNFSFIEKQNALCNSGGNMGYFYDAIYSIQEGVFVLVAEGQSEPIWSNEGYYLYDEENNLLSKYYWNGQEVLEKEYENNLIQTFNEDKAIFDYDLNYYSTIQEAYENVYKPTLIQ